MSELDPTTLRRELLIEQGIERQLDKIVQQANKTAALLEKQPRMEESQLRNLLNAALESRSIEVVINFIRYQIARSESAWGTRPESFGHTVIHDLNTVLPDWAAQVIRFVQDDRQPLALTAQQQTAIHVRLMQLYLGYLSRAFYYGKKTNDFAKLTTINTASLIQSVEKEARHGT